MTRFDPERHHRRSIRLCEYDYAQPGAYFVTVCTHDRACLFGEVVGGQVHVNDAGRIADACWRTIPDHFLHVALDTFVIMPNHVHGIIWIVDEPDDGVHHGVGDGVGAKHFSPPPADKPAFRSPSRTVGSIVRGFKVGVTKWMRANLDIHNVWQRDYFEHVVRDESDLERIRRYIAENPARWTEDLEHPNHPDNCRGEAAPRPYGGRGADGLRGSRR
jgi:putative transposase